LAATPILAAMVAGALAGWLVGPEGRLAGVPLLGFFEFLGTIFINLLKMVVVPLISASLITGVASLGSGRDLGRLGLKTLAFYIFTTLLSVLIALGLVDLIRPGIVDGMPARSLLALQTSSDIVAARSLSRSGVSTP